MTREEAITCLQGLLDNPLINKGTYLAQALDMAIQALSQEPCDDATLKDIFCMGCEYREQEPKWIPVSERLPKENETVLINYCRLNERSVRMAIWDELHCRFYNSEYTKYVSVDFVTAWMPLPKPYEPQESEEQAE